MKKAFLVIVSVVWLSACSQMVWVKPGTTTSDFNKDKYDCQQSSMTAAPATLVNTNCNWWTNQCQVQDYNQGNRDQLFNNCMVSKGWSLQKQQRQQN